MSDEMEGLPHLRRIICQSKMTLHREIQIIELHNLRLSSVNRVVETMSHHDKDDSAVHVDEVKLESSGSSTHVGSAYIQKLFVRTDNQPSYLVFHL